MNALADKITLANVFQHVDVSKTFALVNVRHMHFRNGNIQTFDTIS